MSCKSENRRGRDSAKERIILMTIIISFSAHAAALRFLAANPTCGGGRAIYRLSITGGTWCIRSFKPPLRIKTYIRTLHDDVHRAQYRIATAMMIKGQSWEREQKRAGFRNPFLASGVSQTCRCKGHQRRYRQHDDARDQLPPQKKALRPEEAGAPWRKRCPDSGRL